MENRTVQATCLSITASGDPCKSYVMKGGVRCGVHHAQFKRAEEAQTETETEDAEDNESLLFVARGPRQLDQEVDQCRRDIRELKRSHKSNSEELGRISGLVRQLHGQLSDLLKFANQGAQVQGEPEAEKEKAFYLTWHFPRESSNGGYREVGSVKVSQEEAERRFATYAQQKKGNEMPLKGGVKRPFIKSFWKGTAVHVYLGNPIE